MKFQALVFVGDKDNAVRGNTEWDSSFVEDMLVALGYRSHDAVQLFDLPKFLPTFYSLAQQRKFEARVRFTHLPHMVSSYIINHDFTMVT